MRFRFWIRQKLYRFAFGSDAAIWYASMLKMLLSRADVESEWLPYPELFERSRHFRRIIQKLMKWPNDKYLPSDQITILLGITFDDLVLIEFCEEIEKQLGIKIQLDDLAHLCRNDLRTFLMGL